MITGRVAIVTAVRVVFLVTLGAALWSCDTKTYRIPSREGQALTEPAALDASRRALEMAGYDTRLLDPACYRRDCSGDGPYLAKASADSNSGYILWRFKGRFDKLYHLDVRLTKVGAYIDCEVSQVK